MSLQAALDFFEALRQLPPTEVRHVQDYSALSAWAADLGYDCTIDELAQAFRYEQQMRLQRTKPASFEPPEAARSDAPAADL
jgi:ferritin-like metal-binding protein YciE